MFLDQTVWSGFLLSVANHFILSMESSIQTVKVSVKGSIVRYSKPCAATTDAFEQWFECFINQWCLINVQEMHFAHWSIIWAKFGPLNCISKLRFQILTPPGIKLICWLWFSSFCRYIHIQKTGYLSAVRHKIKNCKLFFRFRETWQWIYI